MLRAGARQPLELRPLACGTRRPPVQAGSPRRAPRPPPDRVVCTSARLPQLLFNDFLHAFFLFHLIHFKAATAAYARGGEGAAGGCGAGLRSLRLLLLPGSGRSAEQVGTGAPGREARWQKGPADSATDGRTRWPGTGVAPPHRPPFPPLAIAPPPDPTPPHSRIPPPGPPHPSLPIPHSSPEPPATSSTRGVASPNALSPSRPQPPPPPRLTPPFSPFRPGA